MASWIRDQVRWHAATAAHVLRTAPLWVWLVPILGGAVIWLMNLSPAIRPYLSKDAAEISSPAVLAVGVVIAAGLATTRRHVYDRWQTLLGLALFLRELHFRTTNTGFYIAIVVLLGWASFARERLEPFISNRRVVAVIVAMLWTYAVSKTFDDHWWDAVLRPTGLDHDLFEENLELLGHLLFVVLTVVSAFVPALGSPER